MSPHKLAAPCPTPGCPNRSGQCPDHRQRSAAQLDGKQHQAERKVWQLRIDHGSTRCRRCGAPIPPHQPEAWDLGHPVPKAPECRRCNRGTMGRDRA